MTEPDIYDLAAQAGQSRTDTDKKSDPDKTEPDVTEPSVADPDEVEMHMTYPQLRTAAYNGEFPNEKYPMPDRIFFWSLRDMYQRFKAGTITKEQGEAEKNAASRLYLKDRAKYDDYIKATRRINDLFRTVENAATAYIKSGNRTPEADALYEALYGVTLTDKE